MEFLQEAIASRNIAFWIILTVILFLLFKIFKGIGKWIFRLIIIVGIIALIVKFFLWFFDPLVDFMRAFLLNDYGPNKHE